MSEKVKRETRYAKGIRTTSVARRNIKNFFLSVEKENRIDLVGQEAMVHRTSSIGTTQMVKNK